ncbi:hypothetical protein REPUB_Repub15cG0020100 [Reevesia pubescens]
MGLAFKAELVHDLTLKILLRLPAKSLTRFKCVCKPWNFLFSDPKFTRAHLESMAAIESYHDFILYNLVVGAFYTRIFDQLQQDDQIQATKLENYYCDLVLSMSPTKFTVFIGHCDGLLCLVKQCSKAWLHVLMLWNPSIGELKPFPLPKSWTSSSWEVLGFGRDFSTDEYKLVRVPDKNSSDIEVLNLGNIWFRKAEECLPYFAKSKQKSIFSNGCLYWFAWKLLNSRIKHDLILCFDLAKEKVREVLPPPCSEEVNSSKLRLLHGSVCILNHNKVIGDIDVWIMKENIGSMHTSWMKQITLPGIPNCGRIWQPFPLCYIRKDKVLVSVDNNKFFIYNPKDESYDDEKLNVHGIQHWGNVIPYIESLVSPFHISKAWSSALNF